MANKKVTVKFEGTFTFEYDPDSKEFKNSLESYNDVINKGGDEYSVLKQVAHHFLNGGSINDMIEGVGYVKHKRNKMQNPYLFSGIIVENDLPFIEYEIV